MKHTHGELVSAVNEHFGYNGDVDISMMPISLKKQMILHYRRNGSLNGFGKDAGKNGRNYRSVTENLVEIEYVKKELNGKERIEIYPESINPDSVNLTHFRAITLQEKGFQVTVRESNGLIALLVSNKIQEVVQNA